MTQPQLIPFNFQTNTSNNRKKNQNPGKKLFFKDWKLLKTLYLQDKAKANERMSAKLIKRATVDSRNKKSFYGSFKSFVTHKKSPKFEEEEEKNIKF